MVPGRGLLALLLLAAAAVQHSVATTAALRLGAKTESLDVRIERLASSLRRLQRSRSAARTYLPLEAEMSDLRKDVEATEQEAQRSLRSQDIPVAPASNTDAAATAVAVQQTQSALQKILAQLSHQQEQIDRLAKMMADVHASHSQAQGPPETAQVSPAAESPPLVQDAPAQPPASSAGMKSSSSKGAAPTPIAGAAGAPAAAPTATQPEGLPDEEAARLAKNLETPEEEKEAPGVLTKLDVEKEAAEVTHVPPKKAPAVPVETQTAPATDVEDESWEDFEDPNAEIDARVADMKDHVDELNDSETVGASDGSDDDEASDSFETASAQGEAGQPQMQQKDIMQLSGFQPLQPAEVHQILDESHADELQPLEPAEVHVLTKQAQKPRPTFRAANVRPAVLDAESSDDSDSQQDQSDAATAGQDEDETSPVLATEALPPSPSPLAAPPSDAPADAVSLNGLPQAPLTDSFPSESSLDSLDDSSTAAIKEAEKLLHDGTGIVFSSSEVMDAPSSPQLVRKGLRMHKMKQSAPMDPPPHHFFGPPPDGVQAQAPA